MTIAGSLILHASHFTIVVISYHVPGTYTLV